MGPSREAEQQAALHDREGKRFDVETARTTAAAAQLGVEVGPIAPVTVELNQKNVMRRSGEKQYPEGLRQAEFAILDAAKNRQRERLTASRYPINERGRPEIAPEQYQVAHQVTKKLDQAFSYASDKLKASLDPTLDQHRFAAEVIRADEPFSLDSEGAILDMLGIDPAAIHDAAPDSVQEVKGGTIFRSSVEEPDGVVYQRETHMDTNGQDVYFRGSIIDKDW